MITDGRFSGATRGPPIGHVSPEAAEGGPIALIHEGDEIEIDIPARRLELLVSADELARRSRELQPRQPEVSSKLLRRYARDVSSAASGAILR